MSDEHDRFPPRLLLTGSVAQKDLLAAGKQETPQPGVPEGALHGVLAQRAAEQRATTRRVGVGVAALSLAAAAAFLWRTQARPSLVAVGEPSPAASAAQRAPAAASASALPLDPLAPCAPAVVAAGRQPLIDDFEDGDTQLPWLERRGGFWSVFNDGSGKQRPLPGTAFKPEKSGRDESRFAFHVSGGKFSKWGAAISVPLSPRGCYDASVYGGFQFWARGRGVVTASALMTQVVAEQYGGSCQKDCSDMHGALVELGKSWTLHRVHWDDLKQRGRAAPIRFDPRSLFSIQFSVRPEQTPFDYAIDDVSFLPR